MRLSIKQLDVFSKRALYFSSLKGESKTSVGTNNKPYYRTPKDYDGPKMTTHHIKKLLPSILTQIGHSFKDRPDLILAAWPELIGPTLAPMTQAIEFREGILKVLVKNSTLYSLLSQHEKPRILNLLREKFPGTPINNIHFRLG